MSALESIMFGWTFTMSTIAALTSINIRSEQKRGKR